MIKISTDKIIRAWKNPEFRAGLNNEDLAQMPENPVGAAELEDADLALISAGEVNWCSFYTCQSKPIPTLKYCLTDRKYWQGC